MCDTLVVVQSDGVLFAKNSDRDANEAQLLDWQPRRTYAAGTKLECTWIEIPQVRETHAVLLSRPFWMWGAEMGANEHGVVIGNEAVFTRQPYADSGLTGMDLLRLALERAESARAAVDVIVELLETHGQGGGCGHENRRFTYHNSFLIADPHSAFVLETAGKLSAVEEVRGARSISNTLTIPGFAEAHSDTVKTWACSSRSRRRRTQALAEETTDVAGMLQILRDHGPGHEEPQYSLVNGGMGAPCMHAGGMAAASQTTASWVADLRGGIQHWVTGTAAPCCSLFKPVRIDEPLDLGPIPDDTFDAETLWWRHELLHRRVMHDPTALRPLFIPERDQVEAAWLIAPPEPAEAFRHADELLHSWTQRVAAEPVTDHRPGFVRRYWSKRDRRAQLPEPIRQPAEAVSS